jgi:hypothetical protein
MFMARAAVSTTVGMLLAALSIKLKRWERSNAGLSSRLARDFRAQCPKPSVVVYDLGKIETFMAHLFDDRRCERFHPAKIFQASSAV